MAVKWCCLEKVRDAQGCPGLLHVWAVLTSTHECIHCAAFPCKLLHCRLACQANLLGSNPLLCEAATAQGEIVMRNDLATMLCRDRPSAHRYCFPVAGGPRSMWGFPPLLMSPWEVMLMKSELLAHRKYLNLFLSHLYEHHPSQHLYDGRKGKAS